MTAPTAAAYAALEREFAVRSAELEEARTYQAAIGEVLRVISASPTDLQPVFDAITERAMALCGASMGAVTRFDGEMVHLVAYHGASQEAQDTLQAAFPMRPGRGGVSGRAILERAPVQIPDVLADLDYGNKEAARRGGFRNLLAVPMLREGQVLGTINVARTEPGVFSVKLVNLLQTFADQAVIAIENVRLFNETNDALERQTATAEILKVISGSPTDVQPVFDAIAERAAILCGAPLSGVARYDGEMVDLVAHHGFAQEALTEFDTFFPMKPSRVMPITRAILERAPVQSVDLINDPDYPEIASLVRPGGYRSALAVPLLREGQCVGAIIVVRMVPGPFADKLVTLLQTFADQAVIAIENVRLFNETKDALERQTATADILKVISSSPTDVQPVFDAIAERAMTLCGARFGSASRFDGEWVHLLAVHGLTLEEEAAMRAHFPMKPARSTISARAVLEREPVQIADVIEDTEHVHKGLVQAMGYRSLLAVPMLREGHVVGSIGVGRAQPGLFPDKLVTLLQTFADQAVIAIENVRLFNETKEGLDQQTAISDILRVITESPTDVQPVLDTIADHAVRLCDAASASLFLIEVDKLRHVASRGPLADQVTSLELLPIDRTSTSGRAVLERRTVQVEDMHAEIDEYPRGYEVARRLGHRTIVVAPLFREGTPFGTILLRRQEVRPFSAREVALLRTFGDQAAIALENVRLFNETKEALEHQTATAEVLRVISSSVADTAPVFEKILDSCERLFATKQLFIFLVRDDGQLHLGASRGVQVEAVASLYPKPPHETINGVAIRERRTVHYPDVASVADKPFEMSAAYDLVGNHSVIVAPMLWEGRGIGTILVARIPPRPFTDKEIALLTTFADQVVIAIENARLFHEIEYKSRQLAVANQHKSEFLANMSHELRTPLNAIIGFSEVLIERMFGELNDKQADYLKDIHSSGRHLLALINDILDLSKIEAGRMELEVEEFDVQAALDNTLTLIRERAQQHGIALSLDANVALGSIRADQRKFKQIMLNLLSNAVKFTPDGGRIDVRARLAEHALEVAVSDTGIGIAAADQEAVFQEFRQVGGHYTNKQEGTGLGLALTKRFVELHGGTLGLASEPGRGSTFTFTMPRQP